MKMKTSSVLVRVSPDEKIKLLDNSKKLNLNISEFIRVLTLIEPKDILEIKNNDLFIVNNKTELENLKSEINRIGVNINQCTKAINTVNRFYQSNNNAIVNGMKEVLDEITEKSLKELYANIEELKQQIIEIENKLAIKRKAGY